MPLAAGTRLGAYEIRGPIGAGGMGEVYRADDARLRRTVAIKILPPHLATPDRLERFQLGSPQQELPGERRPVQRPQTEHFVHRAIFTERVIWERRVDKWGRVV